MIKRLSAIAPAGGPLPTPGTPGTQIPKLTVGIVSASVSAIVISWTNTGQQPYTVFYAGQAFKTSNTSYSVPGSVNGGKVTVDDASGQSYSISIPDYMATLVPQPSASAPASIGFSLASDGSSAKLNFTSLPNVPIQLFVNGNPAGGVTTASYLASAGYMLPTTPGGSYAVSVDQANAGGGTIASVSFTVPAGQQAALPSATQGPTGNYTLFGVTLPIYGWAAIAAGAVLLIKK